MCGRLWTDRQVELLKQMAARGYSGTHIARRLNRTPSAVYSRVQLEGLKLSRGNRFIAGRTRSRPKK